MANREDLQRRLLATFREEAVEHIDALERELAAVSDSVSSWDAKTRVETLFRVMHTLKGAARSVRFTEVEDICQQNEALLRVVTQSSNSLTEANLVTLKTSTERLRELVYGRQFQPSSPARSAAADEPARTEAPVSVDVRVSPTEVPVQPRDETTGEVRDSPASLSIESVRVDVERLDRLLLVAEDLLLPSLVVAERARAARRVTDDVATLRRQLRAMQTSRNGGEAAALGQTIRTSLLESLRDIEGKCRRLSIALDDDQRALRLAVNELFTETRQARMLPAATMLAAFPAMVRDLCRETGKQAKWRVKESGVELDRKVIELVKNPLIQLVRNAIDHGIELPDDREAAGKTRRGRITISIRPIDGGRVAIELVDDGRGMNVEALRDALVRSRIAPALHVQGLSDSEVIDLAFRPGVSTSPVITSISGLGLGLSIVHEQVERIDGRIIVRSTPGRGTTMRLELPATIASYRGLLVSVGNCRLLCPAESVERVIGIGKAEALAATQAGMIAHGTDTLPFGKLATIIGVRSPDARRGDRHLESCVVMSSGPRRAVLMVDEILGEMDVLVKDLPLPLKRVRNIASAGLLATGETILVLRPADVLVAATTAREIGEHVDERDISRTLRVLVVDDSITTRTMERNLFDAAGYTVFVAADGIEAWSILQSEMIDLVISDIDMPRMDGFELTAKIRQDSRLAELPVVLVTALESRDDKERGIRIGANAYVLKSSFDQSNLLEIVRRLI